MQTAIHTCNRLYVRANCSQIMRNHHYTHGFIQFTQYGIKLKATAPSVHMIRVDVETEVSPMIGSEQQSADLVEHLIELYRTDPNALWETNMLGKPLSALVEDDLKGKTGGMPEAVQIKLRRALKRVVNEGKGGILCILI